MSRDNEQFEIIDENVTQLREETPHELDNEHGEVHEEVHEGNAAVEQEVFEDTEEEVYKKKSIKGKIAVAMIIISAAGGGMLFTMQNGYLDRFMSTTTNSNVISEIDSTQNQTIRSLQLQVNDMTNQFTSMEVGGRLGQLESDFDLFETNIKAILSDGLENQRLELIELINGVDKHSVNTKESIDAFIAHQEVESEGFQLELDNALRQLALLRNDKRALEKDIEEFKKKSTSTNGSSVQVTTPKSSKGVTSAPIVKPIEDLTATTYGGLILEDTFRWGSEYIASLSDNTGSVMQVETGTSIGSLTVQSVMEDRVVFIDKLDGKKITLVER